MTVTAPLGARVVAADRDLRREAWLDNLRVAIVAGVIGSHVAVIYALDVDWYYEERTAGALASALLAAVFAPGLLFGMGLLFFLAGLFTPPAFGRKGIRRFVGDRLWRLGVPTIAYLLVVNPALDLFGDRALGRGEPLADYINHSYRGDVELGVAWFMAALSAFSIVYAAWRSRHPVRDRDGGELRLGDLVGAGVFIAAASFAVRLGFPVLSGEEPLALNLWEYPQMAAMFALGVLAAERGWMVAGLTPRLRRTCGRAAGAGVASAVLLGVVISLSDDADPFLGGFRIEATLLPVIEATLALGMSLWLVDWFRRRANRPWRHAGGLGRASFAAYLVHVPITVLLAIVLRDVGLPAELKLLIVFGLGAAGSFGLGSLLGRSRVAGRIL